MTALPQCGPCLKRRRRPVIAATWGGPLQRALPRAENEVTANPANLANERKIRADVAWLCERSGGELRWLRAFFPKTLDEEVAVVDAVL